MAERQLVERDLDEARLLGGRERAQVGSRPLQHREVAGLLGRGEREQPARRLGQRCRSGAANACSTLVSTPSPAASSISASGLPSVDLEDPVGVAGREGLAGVRFEDRGGGVAVETAQDDRVEALRQLVAGPRRDQHRDRVGEQAPGGEQDRPERRLVDPLGVVDRDEQRALLGAQRRAGSASRRRSGSGRCACRARARARPSAPPPAARAVRRSGPARAAAARAGRRTGSRTRTRPRAPCSTVISRACSTAYSSSAVFPIPGSPAITSTWLVPSRAVASSCSMRASSSPRPITMWRSYGGRPGSA